MKKTFEMTPKGMFGEWLFVNMMKRNLTCSDVANMLHTTRQTISNHINNIHKPTYVWVIAYCSIFGGDPDMLWKTVEES